jgi:hypothetical protein
MKNQCGEKSNAGKATDTPAGPGTGLPRVAKHGRWARFAMGRAKPAGAAPDLMMGLPALFVGPPFAAAIEDARPFRANPCSVASKENISTFALNDVLQRIQGPSQAVAHVGLGFLERLDAGLRLLQLEPQGVALALERRQPVGRARRFGGFRFAALRVHSRSGSLSARSIPAAWGHR